MYSFFHLQEEVIQVVEPGVLRDVNELDETVSIEGASGQGNTSLENSQDISDAPLNSTHFAAGFLLMLIFG